MSATPASGTGSDVGLPRRLTPARHGPQTRNDAVQRMRNHVDDSLSVLETLLSLASKAAGEAPIPGLSFGLEALSKLLKGIQIMRATVRGVDVLHENIRRLSVILVSFYSRERSRPFPEEMLKRIVELFCQWAAIAERAQEIKSRGPLMRFITANGDIKKLEDLVANVNTSIQCDFVLESLLNIEESVASLRQDVEVIIRAVVIEMRIGLVDAIRSSIPRMPRMPYARFRELFQAPFSRRTDYQPLPPISFRNESGEPVPLQTMLPEDFRKVGWDKPWISCPISRDCLQKIALRVRLPGMSIDRCENVRSFSVVGEPITKSKLGHRIASVLKTKLTEYCFNNGCSFGDVVLIELRQVSRGSWQPILGVIDHEHQWSTD